MRFDLNSKNIIKIVQFALLIAIFGLLLWSQPWDNSNDTTRTITVSGEATIEAVPDQFVFYPYFEATGANDEDTKELLLNSVNTIIEDLTALGVASDDITLNADSLDRLYQEEGENGVLRVSLEIKVDDKETAQKVQDYLLTKNAKGQISPQASFSEDKQKELQKTAIEEASKDAREKAETKAGLFGASIGDAIAIDDSNSGSIGYPEPYLVSDEATDTSSSLPVLPGQNEYSLTVNVTYELQ